MTIIQVTTMRELQQCFEIRKKVFVEEQGVPPELETDEYDASPEAAGGHALILSEDGAPAGTGRWIWYEGQHAKLQRIAVLRERRGQGLGKAIVMELERQALQAGAEYCLLDSQCHAESFYMELGYLTISEEPFLDAGMPHVRMQKKLQMATEAF
jgi:predicted GNAT family N-acyltransferase